MRSVKASDVADVIFAVALFVVMVCFWCMLDITAQLAFRLNHFGSEEFAFLATITIIVLFITLLLAREIAKFLPNTAGRVVFQFKKKEE